MKPLIFLLCLFSTLFSNEMSDILTRHDINGFDRPGGTDKDTIHSYLASYTELLEPYRNQHCSLLEIGSWCGGSALLWNDYLPQAQISLIDIQNAIHPKIWSRLDSSRCRLKVMNAYTLKTLDILRHEHPEGFDIIIDDGDHALTSQLFVLKHYTCLLKEGGLLVIEDIPNEHALEILQQSCPPDLTAEVIDLRAQKNRWDDILFVVRKKHKIE